MFPSCRKLAPPWSARPRFMLGRSSSQPPVPYLDTVQYSTVQYSTVQYSTVQYSPPASRRCRTWTPSSWCSGHPSAQPCHRQRWRRRLCKHDEDTLASLSRLWILLLDGIFQQEGVPLHGAAICEQVHGAGAAPAAQQQHAARHAPGGVARPLAAQLARPRPPPPRQHQAEPGAAGAAERPAVSRVQVPGTGHT